MNSRSFGTLLALLLLIAPTKSLHAQVRIELVAVGLSVEVPATWSEHKIWDAHQESPELAFYHIQVSESGKFAALRREECRSEEKQAKWVGGVIEAAQLGPEDTITPLSESASVTYNDHAGYLVVSPRENAMNRSYSFNWVEDDHCYRVQLGSPEGIFAATSEEFRQIIASIRATE